MTRSAWVLAVPTICSLLACGGGGGSTIPAADGGGATLDGGIASLDGGAPAADGGATADGGALPGTIVTSDDGRAEIYLPPGSVPPGTTVTLRRATTPPTTNELAWAGITYELEPSGATFTRPAVLAVLVDGAALADLLAGRVSAPSLGFLLEGADGLAEPVRGVTISYRRPDSTAGMLLVVALPHFSRLHVVEGPLEMAMVPDTTKPTQDFTEYPVDGTWTSEAHVRYSPSRTVVRDGGTYVETLLPIDPGRVALRSPRRVSSFRSGDAQATMGSVDGTAHYRLDSLPFGAGAIVTATAQLHCDAARYGVVSFHAQASAAGALQERGRLADIQSNYWTLCAIYSSLCEAPPRTVEELQTSLSAQAGTLVDGYLVTEGLKTVFGELELEEQDRSATFNFIFRFTARRQTHVAPTAPRVQTTMTPSCTSCPIGVNKSLDIHYMNHETTPIYPSLMYARVLDGDKAVIFEGGSRSARQHLSGDLNAGATREGVFRYRCFQPGADPIAAVVWANGHPTNIARTEITCYQPANEILLADNTRVARSGSAWQAAATGAVTNLAHTDGHPANRVDVAAKADHQVMVMVSAFPTPSSIPWEAHQFDIVESVRLASLLQEVHFTQSVVDGGARFTQSGLLGAPVFAANDQLTVTLLGADGGIITLADGGTSITTPAPPPLGNVNELLGAPNGGETTIQVAEGSFQHLVVLMPAATATFTRRVAREAMTLVDGKRTTKLLDADARAFLDRNSVAPTSVYIGLFNQTPTNALFGEDKSPAWVMAGRFVQVSPADLGLPSVFSSDGGTTPSDGGTTPVDGGTTTTPDGGTTPADGGTTTGPVVRTCAELPASFPDAQPPSIHPVIFAVCILPNGTCKVTNDPYSEGAPTQCNDGNDQRAAYVGIGENNVLYIGSGSGWRVAWQSANPPRLATDESAIVERLSDSARYRIDFRVASDRTATVTSVAPHTGGLPDVGVAYQCTSLPRTFSTPIAADQVTYARFCFEPANNVCSVHGDVATSPEMEAPCALTYAFAAGIIPGEEGAAAQPFMGLVHSSGYFRFESASHGTFSDAGISDLPLDTDVTVVLMQTFGGTARYRAVVRFGASAVTVQGVTRL